MRALCIVPHMRRWGYRSFREKFTFRPIPSPSAVYRKNSEDLGNRAIALYDQGLIPDDISKVLEISKVIKIIDAYVSCLQGRCIL